MDRFHCFLIAKRNDHRNTFLMKYFISRSRPSFPCAPLHVESSSMLSSSVRLTIARAHTHTLSRRSRSHRASHENVKVDENYILCLNSVGTIYLRYCLINITFRFRLLIKPAAYGHVLSVHIRRYIRICWCWRIRPHCSHCVLGYTRRYRCRRWHSTWMHSTNNYKNHVYIPWHRTQMCAVPKALPIRCLNN